VWTAVGGVDGDAVSGKAKAGVFGSFAVLGERTEE
jgi:hypothetical protein